MLKIVKGGEYKAAKVKTGETDRGAWEMITVKEDAGAHRALTLFADNAPVDVKEGGRFRVLEINSAGPRRSKNKDGSWSTADKIIITANIEAISEVALEELDGDDPFGALSGIL